MREREKHLSNNIYIYREREREGEREREREREGGVLLYWCKSFIPTPN